MSGPDNGGLVHADVNGSDPPYYVQYAGEFGDLYDGGKNQAASAEQRSLGPESYPGPPEASSGLNDQRSEQVQNNQDALGPDGQGLEPGGELPGPPQQDPAPGPAPPPPPPQRRHRWGAPADGSAAEGTSKRKKRSRWADSEEQQASMAIVVAAPPGMAISKFTFPKEVKLSSGLSVVLPASLTGDSGDPRFRAMHEALREVERKLESGVVELPPEGQRSPSPEPVYDRNGVRLNTREIRYKEKLLDRKHQLIEDLIKEDPNYKPPADYRPRKFQARVRLPQDEYPSHNFIGLLIGPRGMTQKRMQQETNTKIAVRGKGSVKEGANKDSRHDHALDEELHVLVTGNTQEDVDRAVAMIELLCHPDDDSLSEHKKLQLRELAAINGTLRDEVACPICGDFSHRGYECPKQKQELYVLPENIKAQVEEQYKRDIARVRGADAVASEDDYKTFLKELGGAPPPELMGEVSNIRRGLGTAGWGLRGRDLPDDCKLYVGSLPSHFKDEDLRGLFESFGNVGLATVVLDQMTGASRHFGFVHFDDPETARKAADSTHGKIVDGRSLVVRVRSDPPQEHRPGPRFDGPRVYDNVNTLYVTAIAHSVNEGGLRQLFETYGKVAECKLITDKVTGVSKGFAFVTMGSEEEMERALRSAHGQMLEGRSLIVKRAGDRDKPGGGDRGGFRDYDRDRDRDRDYRGPRGPWGGPQQPPPFGGPPPGHPMAHPGPMGGPPGPYGPPPGPYGAPPPGPYGAYPPPGSYGAPPGPYGAPPPGPYGAPPPYGALPPYGVPPPGPYGAPPLAHYPGYPPQGAPPGPYPGYGYGMPGQPPMPGYGEAPPLPTDGAAPPPPPAAGPAQEQVQSEYEKFMSEMQQQLH